MAEDTQRATTDPDDPSDDRDERGFVGTLQRIYPGTFPLAILLAITALVATTPYIDPNAQIELFATGFVQYLPLQAAFILLWLLPPVIVESPPFGWILDRIASIVPTTQRSIIYTTGLTALTLGWLNWAFGLIGGVFVGQRLCARARRENVEVHYPLVLTAGLLSLVLANQGPTSPGALVMTDQSGPLALPHLTAQTVPLQRFLFHPANLVSSLLLALTLPALLVWTAPDDERDIIPLDERNTILQGSIAETLAHYTPETDEERTVADRLEQSPAITVTTVGIGAASTVGYVATGGSTTFLWTLFALVVLGLAAQWRPIAFTEKIETATRWIDHVAVPFMFYGGVVALLSRAGLYGQIGPHIADESMTLVGAYLMSMVVGLSVTDPGSLWVLVSPAVDPGETPVSPLVAVMYGAGVSNLWLGFLFAGTLSLHGFDVREFVRYAALVTTYVSVVVIGTMVLLT